MTHDSPCSLHPRAGDLQSLGIRNSRAISRKTRPHNTLRSRSIVGTPLAYKTVRFASMPATALQPSGGCEPGTTKGERIMKLHQTNSGRQCIAQLVRQMALDAALGGAFGALFGLMIGGFATIGEGRSLEHLVIAVSVSACCGIAMALLGLFDGQVEGADADEPANPVICGKVRPSATAHPAIASVESFPRRSNPSPAEILRTSA